MCGILLSTCNCEINAIEIIKRGPDSQNIHKINDGIKLLGCTLHQQGTDVNPQPLHFDNSILLWNGENYENKHDNDGVTLIKTLNCLSQIDMLNEFAKVSGPYATIYIKNNDSIYFGRDVLGRRSLLCGLDDVGNIRIISSVIVRGCLHVVKWIELPAVGMFHTLLGRPIRTADMLLYPYNFYNTDFAIAAVAAAGLSGVTTSCHNLETNYIIDDIRPSMTVSTSEESLPREIIERLLGVLERSVHRRVTLLYRRCEQCVRAFGYDLNGSSCNHSKVAILFSGGIDSAVIAVLADRFVPLDESIDLLNVSFATAQRTHRESPDRLSGLICLEELRLINPSRRWNFVEIDVSPAELKEERSNRIAKLILPCDSVLDDSIGCALWFAARGIGRIEGQTSDYSSPARVVLTGIGADELMAGYSRHRSVFDRQGYEGLQKELDTELHRISSRNMGRDDRVISSHGKEGRFPFLDEEVVSFLMSLPVTMKCDLTKERGLGEKMILRLLARDYLQLNSSWANHKRAIQFGSQIAKVDRLAKGDKASQKCSRIDICR